MFDLGDDSPWGEIQHIEEFHEGIYDVSTASHGGVMVETGPANSLLSKAARSLALRSHGCYCFEEDCNAAVAFRELMDRGIRLPRDLQQRDRAALAASFEDSIQRWNPDYWKSRQRMLTRSATKRNQVSMDI